MAKTNAIGNVTAGKPKKSGAVFTAERGTTAPVAANTALDADFVCLGYVSDDGLTNSASPSTTTIKAWGGDTVLTPQNEWNDSFRFTLIEAKNADVLAVVFGSENVAGDLSTGIAVQANANDRDIRVYVFDMILSEDTMKRIVVPAGKITNVSDVNYRDNDVVGYEVTVQALPDEAGNTHYEYIKQVAA